MIIEDPTSPPETVDAPSVDAPSGVVRAASPRIMNLAVEQSRIVELIATGASLEESLDALLRFLEHEAPDLLCSVLLLDADRTHLRHCAAPSLPAEYCRAIDGSPVGPTTGSCGTAAYRGEQVVVSDIETDPLWTDYRELARPHGLRACWSTPIFGPSKRVIGTFAMYFKHPGTPTEAHQEMIGMATHVASIAICKAHREGVLRDSEERYRLLNLATKDAVWDWDVRKNTLWWNESVQRLFGYAAHEVTDSYNWWVERVHPDDRERVHRSLQAAAASDAISWREDYRFRRRDGTYADILDRGYVMRDASGTTVRLIGTMQDISALKQAQLRIEQLAYQEPVTELPNRTALQRDLLRALETLRAEDHDASAGSSVAPSEPGELGLLLINLNYFRDINDALGHQNGDLLLRHTGERLRRAVGPFGQVAALGGDEFAVLIPKLSDRRDIDRTLAAMQACLQHPFQIAGIPIKMEATVGIAVYPRDGDTPEILWRHADVALRTAKQHHTPYLHYHPAIDHSDPGRLALASQLLTALATSEDQLLLHFQPKLDLRTGRTVAVEALLRWEHPTRGLLFPDTFVPLAERTGIINPLTNWVVDRALRAGVALTEAGFPLDLSVNVSARNLHDPSFCPSLLEALDAVAFPLSRLTLEITETAIMTDPGRAKAALTELHAAGIHLSMDDFGIGESSLAYLKDLPITKMKIDKSFVMSVREPRHAAIVRSAIDLGRNLGLCVTAEGIEDEATYHALRDLGCELGQGYFFSKPLAMEPLITWFRESSWGYG
jgi:diguanylate cyclase (GGDEF)-like protein/PAS domain S-box-containing protein